MYSVLNSVEYFIKYYIDKINNKKYLEYEQLYNLYIKYCDEQNIPREFKAKFTTEFKKIGSEKIDTHKDGKRFVYLKGVKLKKDIVKSIIPRYKYPDKTDRERIYDFIDEFKFNDIETSVTREDLYLIYSDWCNSKNYIPVDKRDFKLSLLVSPIRKIKHLVMVK